MATVFLVLKVIGHILLVILAVVLILLLLIQTSFLRDFFLAILLTYFNYFNLIS